MVKTGGDVFYDPDVNEPPHDLLLIAGGIGINPLQSILCHVSDVLKGDNSGQLKGDKSVPGKVLLLYSAVTEDELIFKASILILIS
jgi:ferredoxin-NADP reductase